MKKLLWFAMLLCICAFAHAEEAPQAVALRFFTALTSEDYETAAAACLNGDDVRAWNPPLITREIVYPSVQNVAVQQTTITGQTAQVTLAARAVDLRSEELEEIAFMLPAWDHLDCEMPDDHETAEEWKRLREDATAFSMPFDIPVCLHQVNGVWLVDAQATFSLWAEDTPLDIQAVSYGLITYDEATLAYEDTSDGLPPWKIWLRLESTIDAEGLSEFTLENGLCSSKLEQHHDYYAFGYNSVAQCWKEYGGAYHAVLRVAELPEEGVLTAVRRQNLYTPMYVQRHVSIPFEQVPYDSGVPDGGVRFAVQYYTRIAEEAPIKRWQDTYILRTMGDWLDDLDRFVTWKWQDLPQVRDLPIVNDQYALYLLHGVIEKDEGCFGVYDVTLCTESAVMIPLMEQCAMCPVNGMRYFGADSGVQDFARQPFALPVLIPLQEGADPDETLRAVVVEATFSGELIDYLGEHDSATRVGPRTTVSVDMSSMQRWEGSVRDMPECEAMLYWDAWENTDEEETVIIEYEFPEEEKGAG